jgi:tRNA threonylcarbamoyl adenosine modification protein YjeE
VTSPAPAVDELVLVSTADQMRDLGRRLARLLRAGDLVVLSGPLGAGKTTLAQGIGAGLGVRGPVTSPTFVIARMHPNLGTGPDLVHADAYRLGSRAEVDDLDLDADLATAVTVVEWGEGLVEGLADSCLQLAIEPTVLAIEQEGTGPPAEIAGGEEAELAAELDLPRTVQVRAFGHRWLEAAGTARAVLAGEPHGR